MQQVTPTSPLFLFQLTNNVNQQLLMSDLLCSANWCAPTLALLLSAASLSAQASVTPDRTRLNIRCKP